VCVTKDVILTAVDADGGYVALHPETVTTTQGDTVTEALPEALSNLKAATELYLEEFPLGPRALSKYSACHGWEKAFAAILLPSTF